MYYTYILLSSKTGRHYIGSTSDLVKRLKKHNSGGNVSTKNGRPWKIIYSEEFVLKFEAEKREKEIKSYKGGNAFKNLICRGGGVDNRTRL